MVWDDRTGENAWGIGERAKTDGDKDGACFFVPMAGRSFEVIESFDKTKVCVEFGYGTSSGWS